jgi:hypothetical protein
MSISSIEQSINIWALIKTKGQYVSVVLFKRKLVGGPENYFDNSRHH